MHFRTALACLAALVAIDTPLFAAEPAAGGPAARSVAITIDDVPIGGARWSGDTPEVVTRINEGILAALKESDVPAIGFVTEQRLQVAGQIDARVAVLRSWVASGMELGNHGFSHLGFETTPIETFQDDVIRGEVVTTWITGHRPRYFRFPYNQTGPSAEAKAAMTTFLAHRGYEVAPFTVEHADYVYNAVYAAARARGDDETRQQALDAYLDHLDTAFAYAEAFSVDLFGREVPQILLIHANEINAAVLNRMLEALEQRGYAFISLEQALRDEAYASPDDYVGRWGISWFHRWRYSRGLAMRKDEPDPPRKILEAYRALTDPDGP
jgi:peptidoglycan/xylan/chitin deacetylase (PgdA/CDA1 family)